MCWYLSQVLNGATFVSIIVWSLEISLPQHNITFFLKQREYISFSGGAKNAAELAIFVSQLAIFAVT